MKWPITISLLATFFGRPCPSWPMPLFWACGIAAEHLGAPDGRLVAAAAAVYAASPMPLLRDIDFRMDRNTHGVPYVVLVYSWIRRKIETDQSDFASESFIFFCTWRISRGRFEFWHFHHRRIFSYRWTPTLPNPLRLGCMFSSQFFERDDYPG